MKKAIYISGIISVNLILFGGLFKIMHWPGAGILLIIGVLSLSLWTLPAALINNYQNNEMPDKKPYLHIIVFLVCIIVFMGMLFKIMHWPGASILLILGILSPFVLFLPAYIYQHNKQKQKTDMNFFAVMFLFVYIAVFSMFLAVQPSYDVLNHGARTCNLSSQTYESLKLSNMEFALDQDQKLTELKLRTEKLCATLENAKIDILKMENTSVESLKDFDYMTIKNKNSIGSSSIYFLNQKSEVNTFNELIHSINKYESFLHDMLHNSQTASNDFIREVLSTSHLDCNSKRTLEMQKTNFGQTTLMTVLNHITQIQINIQLAQMEVVVNIKKDLQ